MESEKGILPLARDKSIHIRDELKSDFSEGLLKIAEDDSSPMGSLHLYVYCFYENIFRARYKSVYPLSVKVVQDADGLRTLVLEQYLKPIIRPLNRYEAELEKLTEGAQKGS